MWRNASPSGRPETARSVRIFTHADYVPAGPCPAILVFTTQYVLLDAPLAGRALLGASPKYFGGILASLRVVGLSPADAITVLKAHGLKAKVVRRRTSSGLRRVTGQRGARLAIAGGGA